MVSENEGDVGLITHPSRFGGGGASSEPAH